MHASGGHIHVGSRRRHLGPSEPKRQREREREGERERERQRRRARETHRQRDTHTIPLKRCKQAAAALIIAAPNACTLYDACHDQTRNGEGGSKRKRERERDRERERESEGGREGGVREGGREREREIERVYKTKMSPRINSLCKWQAQSHPPEAHSPQSITRKLNRENA